MARYDTVDGGVACVFIDGPKKGSGGVVRLGHDGRPEARLEFMDGLTYERSHDKAIPGTVDTGRGVRKVTWKGVAYRMDPQCAFARAVAVADLEAALEMAEFTIRSDAP